MFERKVLPLRATCCVVGKKQCLSFLFLWGGCAWKLFLFREPTLKGTRWRYNQGKEAIGITSFNRGNYAEDNGRTGAKRKGADRQTTNLIQHDNNKADIRLWGRCMHSTDFRYLLHIHVIHPMDVRCFQSIIP